MCTTKNVGQSDQSRTFCDCSGNMIVITAGIYLRSGCTSDIPEVNWSANRRGQYTPYKKKHMSKFASFAAVDGQDCRRQNAKFGMILFLVLLSVTFSKQEQSVFQADASDKVKLGFVNQNQEHRADFSKMVVDWEPRAMVMDVALLGELKKAREAALYPHQQAEAHGPISVG